MVSLQKKASFFLAITNPSLFLTTRRIAIYSSSCCAMRDIASTFGLCFFFFFFQLMRIIIVDSVCVCLSLSSGWFHSCKNKEFFFFEIRNGNRNDSVRFFPQKNRSSSGNFCGRSNSERLLRCTDLMYQSFVPRRRRDETRRDEKKGSQHCLHLGFRVLGLLSCRTSTLCTLGLGVLGLLSCRTSTLCTLGLGF